MECHKREFVAAAQSQGTQLDPSLLVNEGSQAEQIEAGDVCRRAISMSKGFWLNHVETNVFDRVFQDYLWLQKMMQIFHFSLVYKNLSSLPGFLSFGSKSRRFGGMFFFRFVLEQWVSKMLFHHKSRNFQWELWWFGNGIFDRPEISWAFPRPSQSTKESFKGCEMKVVNFWPFFHKYSVFLFLANTAQVPVSPSFGLSWWKKHIASFTSSSVKPHGLNVQNWKMVLQKLQVVGFRDIDKTKWHEVPKCYTPEN